MIHLFKEQPKAFYLIFMLEFWERFGFYAVNGILAYYFTKVHGFDDTQAFTIFGAFSALVYGLVSVGGYIGDKLLGTKRTIFLGLIVLCTGYLSLSVVSENQVFLALGIIAVGNGLFKANPSSLLAKCYEPQDPRLHGAFTLYYMAINVGSIFALILGPLFMDKLGWQSVFFISFMGLFSAILNFLYQRKSIEHISRGPDSAPLDYNKLYAVVVGCIVTSYLCRYLLSHVESAKKLLSIIIFGVLFLFFKYLFNERGLAKTKMWVALLLMLEGVIFFTLYQQMPTSINFFAINHVRPTILGLTINPQSFQIFNPIWIMILSPFVAEWYRRQQRYNQELSTPKKFAIGMCLCGISFVCLYFPLFFADQAFKVSSLWLVLSYFFQSFGELLVSALGVAMVAELVPASISGFIMGMWFLTSAAAGFIGGMVASKTAVPANLHVGYESLETYCTVFLKIGLVTLAIAVVMWFIAGYVDEIMHRHSKKEEHAGEELPHNLENTQPELQY
jgi:POT family proton-dependent oligopeptide transporter